MHNLVVMSLWNAGAAETAKVLRHPILPFLLDPRLACPFHPHETLATRLDRPPAVRLPLDILYIPDPNNPHRIVASQSCRIDSFCPCTAPIQSPWSVKAKLFTSDSAVHALEGNISTDLTGEGVLFAAGVAGGERAYDGLGPLVARESDLGVGSGPVRSYMSS